jgi:peptide/nickel transport system substrate-binding protein
LAGEVNILARTTKALIAAGALGVLLLGLLWWTAQPGAPRPAQHAVARGGELVISLRSDPTTYNRFAPGGATAATDLVALLVHARLIRINRATDDIEPMLAESWSAADDGSTYTLRLRADVRFSDGQPFTSADVLFSFRAAYDRALESPVRAAMEVNGKPLEVTAPDAHTVILRFPEPFAPGLRLLDNLPILPRHKLEAALDEGRLAGEWRPGRPLTDIAGLGPFVLGEHVSGQRLVFVRNPHYFRRDAQGAALPYLDRLIVAIVPDQTAETLRLEAGEVDLMYSGEIPPQNYAAMKRRADAGAVRLLDVGVGLEPDFLSFNLRSEKSSDPRASWLLRRELRQAVACGVDLQAIIDTVYLGSAVAISGPVTPGNRTWHAADAQAYVYDPERARQLLASIGLGDRNGDGRLEDGQGGPARFSILTQGGHNRERVAAVIQEQLRKLGFTVDVVALDSRALYTRWKAGDYDAMYFGLQGLSTDPWLNHEFWLSSGTFHFWNPEQRTPATDWEARIDSVMREHAGSQDLQRRQQAFAEVQRIFARELPSIYFVAPRVMLAVSPRVVNATPAPHVPQLLWSADTLGASGGSQ